MKAIGASDETMLSRIAALVFARPPRLPGSANSFAFRVDGTPLLVHADGTGAQLVCVLWATMPDDAQLRDVLSRYCRQSTRKSGAMCSDSGGQLILATRVGPGDDVAGRVARFCDAAVFWADKVKRLLEAPARPAPAPMMLFP